MEQYWMRQENDFNHLRYCLENYNPTNIFVRNVGSMGGERKLCESLEGKILNFEIGDFGVKFFIDFDERINFPLKDYKKGFSVQYKRTYEDGRMFFYEDVPNNPDIEGLPDVYNSVLRSVWDNQLFELTFDGKIQLEEDGWLDKPHWKYWKVKKI